MRAVNVHGSLTALVADEMLHSGRYLLVEQDVSYTGVLSGQFDILGTISPLHKRYVELKRSYNPASHQKALLQFARCLAAFPKVTWEFEYVTPERRDVYSAWYIRRHTGTELDSDRRDLRCEGLGHFVMREGDV